MRNQIEMKTKTPTLIILLALIIGMSSCSNNELVTESPQNVVERIDMKIEGEEIQYIDRESIQSNSQTDLVSYKINTNEASKNRMDFKLKIDENTTLIFKVRDIDYDNIWENTTDGYSLFPNQDVDNKRAYVTAEVRSEGETQVTSYMTDEFPRRTHINVFEVVEFNPTTSEILCRVQDFPILESINSDEVNIINGTFRGAVTFLK